MSAVKLTSVNGNSSFGHEEKYYCSAREFAQTYLCRHWKQDRTSGCAALPWEDGRHKKSTA